MLHGVSPTVAIEPIPLKRRLPDRCVGRPDQAVTRFAALPRRLNGVKRYQSGHFSQVRGAARRNSSRAPQGLRRRGSGAFDPHCVVAFASISAASVTSRQREIALRMAMGASKTDIRLQFFTEAMTIGALGSALGFVTGSLLAWLISSTWGWIVAPSLAVASIAIALGVGSGVIVGLSLAQRAASQSPALAARG